MSTIYGEDLAYIQALGFGGGARGAAPEIVRRLRAAACPVRRVVDAGCGAGPLTAALAAEGFAVTGIDGSEELLMKARAEAPGARFVRGSIYHTDFPECEAITAIGEPLSYHAEGEDAEGLLRRFFERAAAVLPKGGLLIFDVIETGTPSLDGRFWSAGEDWAVLSETVEDTAERWLTREIQTFRKVGEWYRRGRETHRVRLFDTAALRKWLEGCGFTVETAQGYGEQALPPRRRAFFATRS